MKNGKASKQVKAAEKQVKQDAKAAGKKVKSDVKAADKKVKAANAEKAKTTTTDKKAKK